MLQRLPRAPIRQKLMLIAMLTTGGALLLAGIAIIYFNFSRFRGEMKRDLTTLADVIGQTSNAALTFNDPKTAGEILAGLNLRPSITAAALYDGKGNLFARWVREGSDPALPPRPRNDGSYWGDGNLGAFRPGSLKGVRIGTSYRGSNLNEL